FGVTLEILVSKAGKIGSLPRRIAKRVYLPILPALETRISRVTPKRRVRPTSRNLTLPVSEAATRLADLIGQPRPLHLKVIDAPAGICRTSSTLSLTPEAVSAPTIRTTGKGCMRDTVGPATLIVCVATLERPYALVTRIRTR